MSYMDYYKSIMFFYNGTEDNDKENEDNNINDGIVQIKIGTRI